MPLLAKLVDDVGEALRLHAIHDPPRRLSLGGIEPQVERAVGIEGEAAVMVGELVAREADVEQHGIDGLDREGIEHFGQVAVVGLRESHGEAGELARSPVDRGRVAVDRDHEPVGANGVGEEPRVAAAAERAVHHAHAGPHGEERHHLGRQHGGMNARLRLHALTLPRAPATLAAWPTRIFTTTNCLPS
jgi:hypothetical protein